MLFVTDEFFVTVVEHHPVIHEVVLTSVSSWKAQINYSCLMSDARLASDGSDNSVTPLQLISKLAYLIALAYRLLGGGGAG